VPGKKLDQGANAEVKNPMRVAGAARTSCRRIKPRLPVWLKNALKHRTTARGEAKRRTAAGACKLGSALGKEHRTVALYDRRGNSYRV
jgi:hypothetical protein